MKSSEFFVLCIKLIFYFDYLHKFLKLFLKLIVQIEMLGNQFCLHTALTSSC